MAGGSCDPRSWETLVASLYDAAIDEAAWSRLAGCIGKVFRSESVVVWTVAKDGIPSCPSTTLPDDSYEPYRDHFHRTDPWFAFCSRRPVMKTSLSCDIMPDAAFRDTKFYVDYSRSFGGFHVAHASFQVTRDHLGCLNIMRPQDASAFDEDERRDLYRLLPHLLRTFQIRLRLGRIGFSGIGFLALDALAFGTLVCDREANVLFANSAAEKLAKTSSAFAFSERRGISLARAYDSLTVRKLIVDAASGGAGGGLRVDTEYGPALLILVTPLPERFAQEGGGKRLALVAVRADTDQPGLTPATIATIFRLTPAEADLAFALFSGRSLAEFMSERSVSESTVRTQLTRILHKTDCRNQRELVTLIGRLPQLR